MKTENLFDLIEAGIRAEGLRQKAIANNVANCQTPGYRRVDIKFSELLEKALQSGGSLDLSEIEARLYRPKNTPLNEMANDVDLETEVTAMIQNDLRHKTLIRVLHKKYKQMEMAINVK